MPAESIWLQFGIVSILILAAGVIWRELTKFIREQDALRSAEREVQRVWEEKQHQVRDERWQFFLKSMQDEWIKQDGRNNETLNELIQKVDDLIAAMQNHHEFTREAIAVMRERVTQPLRKIE